MGGYAFDILAPQGGVKDSPMVDYAFHRGKYDPYWTQPEYKSGGARDALWLETLSESILADPLPPGQVWAISPGGSDEHAGLFRIEVNEGPGSGVRIVNVPAPGPFRESVKCGEQNLLMRARELVGDRDPRQHEFTIQLRSFDIARSGASLGLPVLLAFCSALLKKSLRGGLITVGGLNLGGVWIRCTMPSTWQSSPWRKVPPRC